MPKSVGFPSAKVAHLQRFKGLLATSLVAGLAPRRSKANSIQQDLDKVSAPCPHGLAWLHPFCSS